MKKIILFFILCLPALVVTAQRDLSGAYGYTSSPQAENVPEAEKDNGYSGTLILLKMEGNTYRFFLEVTTGWPNYHIGELDGTIVFKNDSATYSDADEDPEEPCILKFRVNGETIQINSMNTSFNCEFGQGVYADGDFPWLKKQPQLNNAWLRREYSQSPRARVTATKAVIYKDEKCMVPYTPGKYFIKDDELLAIAESGKSIYTEFITPSGKLVYGWVLKKDIQITNSQD